MTLSEIKYNVSPFSSKWWELQKKEKRIKVEKQKEKNAKRKKLLTKLK